MLPSWLDLLTVLLILSPWDVPVPRAAPEAAWHSLRRVALAAELVGPHERYRSDYGAELQYCRLHWRELRCNLLLQEHLCFRRMICLRDWQVLSAALTETRQRAEVWRCVQEAATEQHSYVQRRQALRRLRQLLGDDYPDRLPLAVPVLWVD